MRTHVLAVFLLVATLAPAGHAAPGAGPQQQAPGAIRGTAVDQVTGAPLSAVVVVATSPVLGGERIVLTDDDGLWMLADLPPGTYRLIFYVNDRVIERGPFVVAAGQTLALTERLDASSPRGERIEITSHAPIIDPASTTYAAVIGLPPDGTSGERYRRIDASPFRRVDAAPLSTFSIDADTASYANVRRFLRAGTRPPADAVRIEELVNYFPYVYPTPKRASAFSITTEVGPAPWAPAHKLVRIGVHTAPIAAAAAPPRNLVFLLDVSGSMSAPDKLPLLREAMNLLVDTLRAEDTISIVVYAGASGLALPPTRGDRKREIRAALAALEPGGATAGAEGIALAYQQARAQFRIAGINRVILCTDGDFNVGVTSEGELTRMIERERERGIALTVLGFGTGNLNDSLMEQLADRGNGNDGYIDTLAEARKLLVAEAGATLHTVAADVKLQVEFNPARVAAYRLLGYENRALADEDFANDAVDAGELGAGHAVTALYELVPPGPAAAPLPARKYTATAPRAASPDLLTVSVRFKSPRGGRSQLATHVVPDRTVALARTTNDFRFAAAVTAFGLLLRSDPHRGSLSWPLVTSLASGALGPDPGGHRRELLALADLAARLAP